MTVIVEDGTGTNPAANSYVSETDLTTFATNRGYTLVSDPTQLLINAMDYIESLAYQGIKQNRIQPLQWPRYNVFIDGYPIDANFLPQLLKSGQMQTAIAIDELEGPQQDIGRATLREKVGDIEVEYMQSAVVNTINVKIIGFLYKLLGSGGGRNELNVSKR